MFNLSKCRSYSSEHSADVGVSLIHRDIKVVGETMLKFVIPLGETSPPYSKIIIMEMSGKQASQKNRGIKTWNNYYSLDLYPREVVLLGAG